jgi:hypothetical protein
MAAPCPADPGSGLVAGPLAGTLPGSANSGQIACQSSGRNSRRVTAWPHSRSIAAQCSIGVLRPGCFHCQTAAWSRPGGLPGLFLNRRLPPPSRWDASCTQG